jgi:phosphate/sulfate permease
VENIYLFFVIALLVLAVADLVVGVGNDAVNFLNSAIGAKVAPFYFILSVAALGVFVGATFSSGMMEIARSGIFHPDQFFFAEIMIIFLAVMITDMILLDVFNTFGLPTSTTVSIVFEILGAAVAVAMVKIMGSTDNMSDIGNYINSSRALAIISGILLSVVIAFTVGALVQFLTRILFTFNYERRIPYLGALWGSLAVTSIVYFILVKGASGASFMTPATVDWISDNTFKLLGFSFIGFAIFFQALILIFKTNILRIIVLIGTFSLAMAFAGNDLVNFIGVPLAGLESYRLFISDPSLHPDTFTMESLLQPVQTPTFLLLLAGLVMVLALFFSKKSRSVTKTEVDLARQSDGDERFSSSLLARNIVRMGLEANKGLQRIMPGPISRFIKRRFDLALYKRRKRMKRDTASFDQLRASVNLFVASILIALATSLKLPLSTTYVTFMVAMGSSLSDKAWGRESAVYRVTGVITVIGGWFFTAFAAFTSAFLIALFISWGGLAAAIIAIAVAFLVIVRTTIFHKKRTKKEREKEMKGAGPWNGDNVLKQCKMDIESTLQASSTLYQAVVNSLMAEKRKSMRKSLEQIGMLNQKTKDLKQEAYITLKKLEEDSIDSGHYYVQILDYLREIAHCLTYIAEPSYDYIDNNHPPLHDEQILDLKALNKQVANVFNSCLEITQKGDFDAIPALIKNQQEALGILHKMKKKQIRMIKAEQVGTRNSMLYFNLLSETKNLLLFTINMIKSHRDFLVFKQLPSTD